MAIYSTNNDILTRCYRVVGPPLRQEELVYRLYNTGTTLLGERDEADKK